jgi:hypothetical protein
MSNERPNPVEKGLYRRIDNKVKAPQSKRVEKTEVPKE